MMLKKRKKTWCQQTAPQRFGIPNVDWTSWDSTSHQLGPKKLSNPGVGEPPGRDVLTSALLVPPQVMGDRWIWFPLCASHLQNDDASGFAPSKIADLQCLNRNSETGSRNQYTKAHTEKLWVRFFSSSKVSKIPGIWPWQVYITCIHHYPMLISLISCGPISGYLPIKTCQVPSTQAFWWL